MDITLGIKQVIKRLCYLKHKEESYFEMMIQMKI